MKRVAKHPLLARWELQFTKQIPNFIASLFYANQ